MVRKGKYQPSRGGPTYLPKDNVRLKVIMWLYSKKRSNQNKMMNEDSGLRGQKWIALSNVLDELCEWGWIEKSQSEDVANVKIYQLLEKGRKIAEVIHKLQNDSSELWKLDSLHDVKLVD